ncbi:MAG TPA: polysaccharide biosynthesis C-terminal domain-containing protein, partial [Polyangiaceae bacterium]
LLYITMPLGSAILAAGRQRAWALVQLLCVVTSSVLDPILIPWFQRNYGNGGLGVNVAGVVSEIWMLTAAFFLVPKGALNRQVAINLLRALAAGVVMLGVGLALAHAGLNPWLAAPVSFTGYAVALWAFGGVNPEHVEAAKAKILRKMRRTA